MPSDEPLSMGEEPASPGAAAVTHHVTDEQMNLAGQGYLPRALCGRLFRPACLLTPLGRVCPECAAATVRAARMPVRRAPALRRLLALRARSGRG